MSADLESSRKFWDQKAKDNPYWYISSFGPYNGRNLEEFWQSGQAIWSELHATIGFAPSKESTVVEIGCGIGRLTCAIAPEVGTVHAFDISSEMLAIARDYVPSNAQLHLTSGCDLSPVTNASADLALAYCVFQHLTSLADFQSYLREMSRVSKKGGVLAFTICERDWKWSLLPLIQLKGFLKSKLGLQPPDLYKKEWLGIRPSIPQIKEISPVPLNIKYIGDGRTLLWGEAH